ncbi:hypothetical protein HN51_056801 [Arachis hypogaea]
MMADKALVRRLSACETMGYATTICSDKTGTLTMNQMTVVEAYAGGKKNDPPGNKSELSPKLHSLLIEGVAQNTNGSVNDVEESSIIHVFPFNSEKKRAGVAVQTADSEVHIHWKGAAEIVLACCTRTFEKENVPATEEERVHWSLPEDTLVLLAIVGLKDPCRPGVKDSVELCQKSGVKVKMVTGDNVKTAKAIAVEWNT